MNKEIDVADVADQFCSVDTLLIDTWYNQRPSNVATACWIQSCALEDEENQ